MSGALLAINEPDPIFPERAVGPEENTVANGAANYTEELVMAMVTTQLTIMSFPIFNVQIIPFSSNFENLFGADAKIPGSTKIAPFYMQFKRPNRSTPTGQISKDRTAFGLSSPTNSLNFGLRKKKGVPVHKLQHNVLYRTRERLHKHGVGDAAYVCSLFLSSGDYVKSAHHHGLWHWPYYWLKGPYVRKYVMIHGADLIDFPDIPWLDGHVSVPPHAKVTSASHSYSFDHAGGDVCFHSPLVIDQPRRTLRDWIAGMAESARLDRAPTLDRSNELLAAMREGAELPDELDASRASMPGWMAFGDALEAEYGISQFAFLVLD